MPASWLLRLNRRTSQLHSGSRRSHRLGLTHLEDRTVPAGVFTWTGAAGDHLWTTAGNWSGGSAPTGVGGTNEILLFPSGASDLTPQDNFTGGSNSFFLIEFTGSGYTLSGSGAANPLTNLVGILGTGANNTITASLPLAHVGLVTVQSGGSLTIQGDMDLKGTVLSIGNS